MTHGGTYGGVAQGSSCRPGPQSEPHSPAAVAPAHPEAPAQPLFGSIHLMQKSGRIWQNCRCCQCSCCNTWCSNHYTPSGRTFLAQWMILATSGIQSASPCVLPTPNMLLKAVAVCALLNVQLQEQLGLTTWVSCMRCSHIRRRPRSHPSCPHSVLLTDHSCVTAAATRASF